MGFFLRIVLSVEVALINYRLMKQLIENFPQHIAQSINQIHIEGNVEKKDFRQVLFVGIGGSGIGGRLIIDLFSQFMNIPLQLNPNYIVPNWVDEHTLVIASSYSGNTEETISCIHQAKESGATIAVVSSGGQALEIANRKNWARFIMPGGEQPRAMLGYSFIGQLKMLIQFGILEQSILEDVEAGNEEIAALQAEIMQEAEDLADQIGDKTPILYTAKQFEGISVRWKQQINENSNYHCWFCNVPEMNHNEIEGWYYDQSNFAPVLLRFDSEYIRNRERMNILNNILTEQKANPISLNAKGSNEVAQALYYIQLGDWLSYFLAVNNDTDPVKIELIGKLKSELNK